MRVLKSLAFPLAFSAALALSACGDDNPVSFDDVDPAVMKEGLADVSAELATNEGLTTLSAMGFAIGSLFPASGSAALRASLPSELLRLNGLGTGGRRSIDAQRQAVRRVAASMRGPRSPSTHLIPDAITGKTMVWDEANDTYIDGNVAGAPSNGVRFRLYELDPLTNLPASPLVQIGYVDITDESTATTDAVGIGVVVGSTTVIDYVVSGSVSLTTENWSVVGFLRALTGNFQIDFDLAYTYSQSSESLTLLVEATGGFTLELATDNDSFDLTIGNGTDEISISGVDTATGETIEVRFNGTLVATGTATETGITWTGAGGQQLSDAELAEIEEIVVGAFVAVFAIFIVISAGLGIL